MAASTVLILAACSGGGGDAGGAPRLELVEDDLEGWVIDVRGLGAAEREAAGGAEPGLRVFTVLPDGTTAGTPVLGTARVERDRVRWRPAYPLVAGRTYVVRWAGNDGAEFEAEVRRPLAAPDEPPRVLAIHPAVEVVPANLLRVYVYFSQPMRIGRAGEHVALFADGQPLEGALVAAASELWSPDQQRLTLLFDPGRIKEGVGPNLEQGAPLREGMELELRVSGSWPSLAGAELEEAAFRRWLVGPEDRRRPDPSGWILGLPETPESPLQLDLLEAHDRALAERLIRVRTAAGEPLAGTVELGPGGRRWSFRPDSPWLPGEYRVVVAPELEDLAGNSLARLFDAPLRPDRVGEPERDAHEIPFTIGWD